MATKTMTAVVRDLDRSYPLEQVVEATRYVETQQKTGNVVLTVNAIPLHKLEGRTSNAPS